MSNSNTRKICCCFQTKRIKAQLQHIQEEKEKMEEVLDLEKILKTQNRLSYFQEVILDELEINTDEYK